MSNKKKILVLGDHPYSPSGVGTSINYFIRSLLRTGKYQFICLGGAIRHENYNPTKDKDWGEDFIVVPVNGYGTQQQVRDILHAQRPDVVWFMTDPRFWTWLWQMEHEIRPFVPMLYFHVWDNFPSPHFNRPYYLSNDMIVTMSKVSSDIVREVAPEVEEVYVPLAVDTDIYRPLPENEWRHLKPEGKTMFFWNNRNARRKMSGSIVWWFKDFLDKVGQDKARLVMHTDPKDINGQDLIAIAEQIGLTPDQFVLSTSRVTQEHLALLYNAADCVINISDAEGVGMGTLEALACETPIIANMTGGLQEQVQDKEGNYCGIPVWPASKAVIGSQEVPYIYEDRVAKEDFIEALVKMHNMSKEERKNMGKIGRKHILDKYSLEKYAESWSEIMEKFIEKHGSWDTRKGYKGLFVKEI
jgi:glycosyltransferase involved in cell wall biosynthesis